MTCREFIELLDDFLASQGDPAYRREAEAHLAGCRSCDAYLDSYRKTVEMGKAAFQDLDAEVPADVPEELIQAILALRNRR